MRQAVRQLAGHVLGRVHGEVDLAGEQRLLELRDAARLVRRSRSARSPLVVIGTSSASRRQALGDQARLRERQRAAARADAQAHPRGRFERRGSACTSAAGRSGSPSASGARSSSPNSSRTICMRGVDAVVAGAALHPQRRLVQQPVRRRRARSPRCARGRARRRTPSVRRSRASTCSTIVVAARAQRADRRQHLERAEPAREALDLLLDDAPRRCAPRPGAPTGCGRTTACRSSMS